MLRAWLASRNHCRPSSTKWRRGTEGRGEDQPINHQEKSLAANAEGCGNPRVTLHSEVLSCMLRVGSNSKRKSWLREKEQ
jgi:hypothetical protein